MLCLHVKQPIQAALLETGHWSCWADFKQNPFFLALSYTGPPEMCTGVTRASVNQQTWDFRTPVTRLGSTSLRSCLEAYVLYIKATDKCASKYPVTATPNKHVGICFAFLCKSVWISRRLSVQVPAHTCQLRAAGLVAVLHLSGTRLESPVPAGRVPGCRTQSQTAPMPWVPTAEGFCHECTKVNVSRAGAVTVSKMRYGSYANFLSVMPGKKIKET